MIGMSTKAFCSELVESKRIYQDKCGAAVAPASSIKRIGMTHDGQRGQTPLYDIETEMGS